MMIGTLCSVILCVCGPASIAGAIAGDANPMPNPWDRYVRPSPQDGEMEPAPTHAPGPNLHAEPYAPNRTPEPEDIWNPVVVVPDWPDWRTEQDGRTGRRYYWRWDYVTRTAMAPTWTPPWVSHNQDSFFLQRQREAERHALIEHSLAPTIEVRIGRPGTDAKPKKP